MSVYRSAVFWSLLLVGLGASVDGEDRSGAKMWTVDSSEARVLFDFENGAAPWPSIDDVVMGGVSRSEMTIGGGIAVFRGRLSLENNGGFASVRSRPADWDLEGFEGLTLRVRGDGRTYGFRIRTSRTWDGVSYQARFEAPAESWKEVSLPFTAFEPVFRGRRVPGYPTLEPAKIKTFGLILADKKPGPFQLEIDQISAYRDSAPDASESVAERSGRVSDGYQRRTS